MYHKWRSYDIWFLRYNTEQTEIFGIFGNFLLFDPPNNPKNQNFEKVNKKKIELRYYHFTNVYHKLRSNDVWFLRCNARRTRFFVILDHFFSFRLSIQKINILKKREKRPGDIIILHVSTITENHMMYASWDMERDR